MKVFRLCSRYLKQYWLMLVVYIGICLLTSAASLFSPYLSGNFIDALVSKSTLETVFRYCFVFALLSISRILAGYASSMIYVRMQANMGFAFNRDMLSHVQGLSLSFIQKKDRAYLNQIINADTNSMIIFCLTILQNLITNALYLAIPAVIVIRINAGIALLFLGFLASYLILYALFKRPIYLRTFAYKEAQGHFFSSLFEQLKEVKFIKLQSAQTDMQERLDRSFQGFLSKVLPFQRLSVLFSSLDNVILTGAQIALFAYGGALILSGGLSIGVFTILNSYFGMIVSAVRYFLELGKSYQEILVSYDRMKEILDHPLEPNGDIIVPHISTIDIKDLCFGYGSQPVIHHENFSFFKGKLYAVTGENGCGKTTLVQLLAGLYAQERQGDILLEGFEARSVNMEESRKHHIGIAEQEPSLINDSLYNNLTLGQPEAVDMTRLDFFIDLLGLNQYAGNAEMLKKITVNESDNLSGGEKQKISILRVLLKDPDVMIFDEPTSALDTVCASRLMRYLNDISASKIIIVITHNTAVQRLCHHTYQLPSLPYYTQS